MSGDKLYTMLLLPVLEDGTYTPYLNWTKLSVFGKKFHLDLNLTCLHLIHDIFTLLDHILKSGPSIQLKTKLFLLLLLLLRHLRAESIKKSKWGGLESSGKRLISSNGKSKWIAFFYVKNNNF